MSPSLASRFRFLAPSFLLAAGVASAQGPVIIVDDTPGPDVDYASISGAVDNAPDESTVIVRAGNYGSFVVRRSMTVLAEEGANVQVDTIIVDEMNDPRGAVVRGFTGTGAIVVQQSFGPVWIEDCSTVVPGFVFGPGPAEPAGKVLGSRTVVFSRVTIEGGPIVSCGLECFWDHPGAPALIVGDSTLALYDCELSGGSGVQSLTIPPSRGGNALEVYESSSIFASGTSLTGGTGGEGVAAGAGCAPVLVAPGPGGFGLWVNPGSPNVTVRLLDTTVDGGVEGVLLDGYGGTDCGAPPGAQGPGLSIPPEDLTVTAGTARQFEASAPDASGTLASLAFTGAPGDVVFLLTAGAQKHVYEPSLQGTLVLAPPQRVLALGVQPPTGMLQFDYVVPPVTEAAFWIYGQTVAFVSDGTTQVGSPSALVWLGTPR